MCTLIEKPPFEASGIPHQIARDEAGFFQPPPTEEGAQRSGLLPPRPTDLRLVDEVGANGELMFGDDTVSPNTIYTYTLVAFDSSYNYSYPILLNASLEGAAEFERCRRDRQRRRCDAPGPAQRRQPQQASLRQPPGRAAHGFRSRLAMRS